MYCKNCRKHIEKNIKFCQFCGAKQVSKSQTTHKKSSSSMVKSEEAANPLSTISGLVIFIAVCGSVTLLLGWLLDWLLGGGIIGKAIAGGAGGGAGWWAVSSFKFEATRVKNVDEESE